MDNLKQKTMNKLFLFLSFFFFIGSINAQTAPIKKKNYVDEQKILNVEAATPRAGYISAPYRKADGNWYEKTDAGVEQLIIDTVAMLATKYDLQNVSVDTLNEIATKYDLSNISIDTLNEIATKYDLIGITSDNIYSADGTLTGDRTVTMGGNGLTFDGGNLFIGENVPSGDSSALLITKDLNGSFGATGAHAVRDESTWNSDNPIGTGLNAYASYDAIPIVTGTSAISHLHSFQSRPNWSGTGNMLGIRGMTYNPTINGTGVTDYSEGIIIMDALGTGTILNNHGIVVRNLTRGTNNNYAILTEGTTPSVFGGDIYGFSTVQGLNMRVTSFNGTGYGNIIAHDASGNMLTNPNLTIINGVLDMKSATKAQLFASATNLELKSASSIIVDSPKLNLLNYGGGTVTGTAAKYLAVESDGDVIEVDPAAGMDAVVANRSYVDNTAALIDLSSGQVYYNTTSNAFVVLP
jgi:hypothetical protein